MRRYLGAPARKTSIVEVSGRRLALTHTGPEATFAVGSADRVYVTTASEYQLGALDAGGNLAWALRVAWEAPSYPQTAIDRQVANLQERYPAVRADMFNWPERLPVLSIILVDGHDHVYVFPYVRRSYLEEHEQRPVDVYSPDGDHLFSGFIKTRWEAAAGDFVYVYEEQEDSGEWAVVRYRLTEPF